MAYLSRSLKLLAWLFTSVIAALGLGALGVYLYFSPTLPNPEELRTVELQTPLRVYSLDGKLITEFGEKRRNPLTYEQIPPLFIDALLASEDDSFFEHRGIDLKGLARASISLIRTGEKRSGGSTITMQVAKNYYLSAEKTFTRKFTEILLALKIEQELSKEEILELYINKIYLGKRAYGIEAAAQVYYGKSIHELGLAEIAMIAGLPQAPSAANPINNPKRAADRRNYVLSRMLQLGKITQDDYQQAAQQPAETLDHGSSSELNAPYLAEMVRRHMVEQYGEEVYTLGYKVYTTVNSDRQAAANLALQNGLASYDQDHGWRQANTEPLAPILSDDANIDWESTLAHWRTTLARTAKVGILFPAIITRPEEDGAWAITNESKEEVWVPFSSMLWAKAYINQDIVGREPSQPSEVVQSGLPVWLEHKQQQWHLSQLPEVEGALISLRPDDGAIEALVGGFSTHSNQFNRVIQADRQPGSAFKPFIYSAALANGFTTATTINDAPVVFEDASLENTWRPRNNSGKFYGPTRLRQALYRSQNLVSIRILNQISPSTAINYMDAFGIPKHKMNADLSLALGASALTPLELATGYATLANGGFAVSPYFISHIEDEYGSLLYEANPAIACLKCEQEAISEPDTHTPDSSIDFIEDMSMQPQKLAPRVMDQRDHFLMISMLKDVITKGTGQRAQALERNDLAGKTGTTNDQRDGWFAGFNPNFATIVWVGFDNNRSLGRWAFGANTALPIWVEYMHTALAEVPEHPFEQPQGIVSVRIDPATGLLATPEQNNAIFEFFKEETVPTEMAKQERTEGYESEGAAIPEQLF